MPRYFFHRTDGHREHDNEGTELEDLPTARKEAVVYAGQTMKDHPEMVWDGGDLKIEVSDEFGLILFVVVVTTLDAVALQKLQADS